MSFTKTLTSVALLAGLAYAQAPALNGIAHVAFRVKNLEATQAFYQKLGYEQAFALPGAAGKTHEAFFKINDTQFIEFYPVDEARPLPPALMHFCYDAVDIDAVQKDLVARGAKPSTVRKGGAGNLIISLRDPEGEVVEYTQYLPGSRHSEARGKYLGGKRIAESYIAASFPAKDPAAMRAFYASKLGFTESAGRLLVPGKSGHFVAVESAVALTFTVDNLKRTAKELKARGLTPKTTKAAVEVTDPDGFIVKFVAQKHS